MTTTAQQNPSTKSPKRSMLTAAFVRTVSRPGKYGDTHGLILRVRPSGSRQWIWRGTVRGRRVDLGLGGYPYTSLAEARELAFEYRKLARSGGDPRTLQPGAQNGVPTFTEAVEKVIGIHRASWRPGSTSEAQWRSSLTTYAYPRLGRMPVDTITTSDVMSVLLPMWNEKRSTAQRVRQRIGAVMKWAIAQGYRSDNPAGDAIAAALPKGGVRKKHFRAIPHGEVAQAVAKVRAADVWPPLKGAFEFQVLTAARPGEVRSADWSEIDIEARVWTVPAERAKSGRLHRVPLTARAIELLEEARLFSHGKGLIFPSVTGRSIHAGTASKLLRKNGIDAVPHGFRSSFRDWCGETGQPREVAEAALAHVVKNQVEAAYARSDLFERRRELMEAWAQYVSS
jgi:integrase